MDKVYLVWQVYQESFYDYSEQLIKVFSTEEKAENYINNMENKEDYYIESRSLN